MHSTCIVIRLMIRHFTVWTTYTDSSFIYTKIHADIHVHIIHYYVDYYVEDVMSLRYYTYTIFVTTFAINLIVSIYAPDIVLYAIAVVRRDLQLCSDMT